MGRDEGPATMVPGPALAPGITKSAESSPATPVTERTAPVLVPPSAAVLAGGAQFCPSGALGPRDSSDGAVANLEQLDRSPSGPAYTVFSRRTRIWITTMVAMSSFVSPMTANIYFPALNPIAADLGVSIGLINLTLTTYMVLQGIAPTLFGDFGDMAGRRPAFIIAFSIYFAANIGLALQNNYAALLALRCLQSAGSSGTLALGFAVVADISVSGERGKYMGFVMAGIQVGPAISPVLGGVLSQYLSWRAIFWFCAIFTVVWMIPYVLSVPETSRSVVGNGSIPPQGWNMTLVDCVRRRRHPLAERPTMKQNLHIPNPFKSLALLFEKDLGLLLFYNSLLYLVFMIIIATLSTEFASIYHFTDLQIGLCYLPYGVGCFIAAIGQGYVLDWNYRRTARKIGFKIDMRRGDDLSTFPIEKARIQPVVPLLALGICATIGYGWALHAETSLAIPLVLHFIIGVCINGSFCLLNTLIVDLYPQAPATAMAANNFTRCSMGAITISFIENMLRSLGRGWTYTFWALLSAALSPILWVIVRWGPKWREERRLRIIKQMERKANKAQK